MLGTPFAVTTAVMRQDSSAVGRVIVARQDNANQHEEERRRVIKSIPTIRVLFILPNYAIITTIIGYNLLRDGAEPS